MAVETASASSYVYGSGLMRSGKKARDLLQQANFWDPSKDLRFLAYASGFLLLVAFLFRSEPFWLTSDDVAMSMIVNGAGIAAAPSPHLVLTNIAWGYLIGWLPHFEAIPPYTLMTYLALALSYFAILYALMHSRLNPIVGSALLLIIYLPTLVYPQFTLVAGYLACAGLALLCLPLERQSRASITWAGVLVVLSGLVRADETVLVVLVVSPLALGYWFAARGSDVRRQWVIMLTVAGFLFICFQLWDYLDFSLGPWAEYGGTYALRTEFTDFHLARYYLNQHPGALVGSGYTINDLRLFQNWFDIDTNVFSPSDLSHVTGHVPWLDRVEGNLVHSNLLLEPFQDAQIQVMGVAVLVILLVHHRWRFALAALLGLAMIMLLLLVVGRPGVTRIYVPVFAALALAGAMQPIRPLRYVYALPLIACLVGVAYVGKAVHTRNVFDAGNAMRVHIHSCSLIHDPIVVIWGGEYPYTSEYQPFDPAAEACPLKIYSLGEYSLAPFSLDQLHRVTRGKDLVPALLAGQSFDFVAADWQLDWLDQYFQEHYRTRLSFKQVNLSPGFKVFRVEKQEEAPRLPAPV